MHYQKINLKTKLYRVNQQDLIIEEKNIYSIQLVPSFDGRTEELKLENSSLLIGTMDGMAYFNLNKGGWVIDYHLIWSFSKELAEEELVIEKTKERAI